MTLPRDIARCPGVGSDDEGWREIPGYEGVYMACPCGKIKSIDRTNVSRNQFKEFSYEEKGKVINNKVTDDPC